MRLRASWKVVAALLPCLAVLTACSGEQERPTLTEAARQLVSDGDALASGIASGLTGLAQDRAGQDLNTNCLKGEAQRYFRAKGNFVNPSAENPPSLVGLLKGDLEGKGYTEIVDSLDLWEDNVSVAVMTHPEAKLTFVLMAQKGTTPNVMIIGKTECYPSSG
ncbi:hypothetical protein ABGB18_41565 [Nonomuraea sp. B12E4]|uniref:hypothetical protein n=1 Tax=Nonomuraea sp. B12E4 TaxID=3153564 RepID=UPI00325DBB6C